ncbi:hypothetical protein FZEAL_658 [Fusarium zealandicum]|uniref:N(6)-L-threonylcarbamoyladenine synthase n=1 Tax=Fusarium zealandicum TaxID=1053134 RepID=A0A8H4XQQ0_9HYPO|nr:hypothetical protein FZEAL_658 [Fusarium zealandicum]
MNYFTQPHPPTQPPPYTAAQPRPREEWEDWEDDGHASPNDAGEQVLTGAPPPLNIPARTTKPPVPRSSRVSAVKIMRLKSKQRQKDQNAKAGIKLITDMSAFRRQNHIAQTMNTPVARAGKFVDAAALRALEGEPNSASVGNWNWFKKNKDQSPATASPQQSARTPDHQKLSPDDRPIVIGIALSSEETGNSVDGYRNTSTPIEPPQQSQLSRGPVNPSITASNTSPTPVQQKSVWSPDTPDTVSSFSTIRYASSIYSQLPSPGQAPRGDVPPVPAVPANFKKSQHQRLISLELGEKSPDDSDSGTPCTLFEEDGTASPQKQAKAKTSALTPDSAASKSHGWWDHHVVTPFMDKRLTFTHKLSPESPNNKQGEEWWNKSSPQSAQSQYLTPKMAPGSFQTPIVRAPTPRRTPSPRIESTEPVSGPSTARASPVPHATPITEKPRIIITDEAIQQLPAPPPYSPTEEKKTQPVPVRYRAVFPPGHPLQAQFPPSPGPASPGLATTMSSQGGTPLTEIPLTPAPRDNARLSQMPLPTRQLGTFVPQEHSHADAGLMTKAERQRRRYEKEEVVARRAGGFWRGRGCIPKSGCFGRTGREGRQRRRVWMIVVGIALTLAILAITLGVVLTRPKDSKEIPSIWVNLTDFPPMPTGDLTIVGPDNVVAKSGCTEPSTMWSCALPKEEHDSVAPYKPNQPTIILQIQWDNSTRKDWKVPNEDPPSPKMRRGMGSAVHAGSVVREREINKFEPSPDPPKFQEMWFLGNTTDEIKSDDKGGEATPFYISLVDTVENDIRKELTKRQDSPDVNVSLPDVLPSPDLKEDGTPKSAVLLPQPVQQPVRLYDRGLPTEHYGFYTYFKRTIYLKSVTVLNGTKDEDVPLDEEGGCQRTEADFLTTWSETRLLVQIWTRTLAANTSTLIDPKGSGSIDGSKDLIRPGTMPYPVTVTTDTHGGDPGKKFVWAWPMDDRQKLDEENPRLLANNIGNPSPEPTLMRPFLRCSRRLPPLRRSLVTLAIETSCDDTGVAILRRTRTSTDLLFNERVSSDNRTFKGIHPIVAFKGHSAALAPLVRRALGALPDGNTPGRQMPDFVSVTRGPGMRSNLSVGLEMAKGLAVAWGVPLVGVHHMQAHALTPRLARALGMSMGENKNKKNKVVETGGPEFPFLSLLVSGGHTQLVLSSGLTDHAILATSGDIAVGNLLDQTARDILPPEVFDASDHVMYGRLLEAFAFPPSEDMTPAYEAVFTPSSSRADEMIPPPTGYAWTVPTPFRQSRKLAFSFSSIFTQVHKIAAANPSMDLAERRALAQHTMAAAFTHLAGRLCIALEDRPELRASQTLVVAGGVASNRFLMHVLRRMLDVRGFGHLDVVAPPVELCTDNAAMIAWAGMEMFEAGWESELSIAGIGRWPIDPEVGEGILGVDGWVKRKV